MSIDDLKPLNEALLLEKPKFFNIIKKFMEYASYCSSSMIPERMADWCSYLQCDGNTCKNEIILEVMGKKVTVPVTISSCNTNISRDSILDYNDTCFDKFFCTPIWASKDYHYVLGIFAMLLATFSLLFNVIYLAGFHKEFGKKKTRTLMLTAQTICDIIYILFTMIGLLSIYSYHSDLTDQLKLYSSFHIYLALYLHPLGTLFESMSIWILILLIFDRFNYLSHGTHSKNLLTKKLCSVLLGSVFVSLICFSALKPFMYQMEKLPMTNNHFRLVYSSIGQTENYQNLLRFWLKMPMEGLLPLTTVFIFIIMVCHKLIFASSQNLKVNSSYIDFQEHRLTKSLLIICILLLIAKVPKMALHIQKYETGIEFEREVKFNLFCEFFDQLYYWIKACFLYQYMCPLFSHQLQNIFCFDKEFRHDNDYLKNNSYLIECDDDNKEFFFEKNCKDFLFKTSNIDKETIV